MTDILGKEITGGAITVEIRGSVHALAYPMHNVIVYKQQTGDSLFDKEAWPKIDLEQDPERWLACLWAGLHERQPDKSWKAPFTIEELGALVDFGNAAAISVEMVKALTASMPKADPTQKKTPPASESISESSGVAPGAASDLVATSS